MHKMICIIINCIKETDQCSVVVIDLAQKCAIAACDGRYIRHSGYGLAMTNKL